MKYISIIAISYISHMFVFIILVIQCFTGGIRKYIGSMKKVVLGEAKPSPIQRFFMDPIYFRIPPVKHCVTNSHQRPFFFK